MHRGGLFLTIAVAGALFCAACQPKSKPPPGYYGQTLPLRNVVDRINENNQALPTLYARHYLEANLKRPEGKTTFVNCGGELYLRKPGEFLLRGRKDVAGKAFEIGSSDDRYLLTMYLGEDTQWWGHHRNTGKPCSADMPIRPDLVAQVLGIGNLASDLREPPVPTVQFNNDAAVYMIKWNVPLPDRWMVQKEIWYDVLSLLPRKVLLFDPNGRIVLRANLSEHESVEVPGRPRDRWPKVATRYELFFPDNGSTMTMMLESPALLSRTDQPKPGVIKFPPEPDVSNVIQIDADCDKK
jgi:hypothetical protein